MLSNDLRSLRGIFERSTLMFDGQVFLDAKRASGLLTFLDHLIATAELQEQLIYASGRPLPEGVVDIEDERRRREVPAIVQGGAA